MKKIIFRADGNGISGLGHLYRVFALIEIYKDSFECELVTKESSTIKIIPKSYVYKTIPESVSIQQEPEWLSKNYKSSDHFLIADGYHFDSAYQKKIKELGYKMFYIDDMTTEYIYADTVINHSLSVKPSDYHAEPYTSFAIGTHYAILRPLFLEAAKVPRKIDQIDTVLVCFGGSDQFNLTLKATKALLKINGIKKINVIIGAAYLFKEIFELQKLNAHYKVYQNLSEKELIEVMKESHLAVVSASNILYEICAVKMPVLAGYYVKNQLNLYRGCVSNEIIFEGEDFSKYTEEDFEKKIRDILSVGDYREWTNAQEKLFDGKIRQRFLDLIPRLNYRRAVAADLMLTYNWANDKVSRANSYFSEPITIESHKMWFEKKLNDLNSVIYIAELENKPAGIIRYDMSGKNAVVGVTVDEEFRGKGLAPVFLKDTADLYFKENRLPVLAYIKEDNIASVRAFEKANYQFLKKEVVHGCNSLVYKLEKQRK